MQVLRLYRMWRRARRLGFPLQRSRGWKPPRAIRMGGRSVPISCPDDLGVINAFRDIFLHDCYGIERVPRPVRTVLDIGANAGFFSLAARNAFPEAAVHAYEPNPSIADVIRSHAEAGRFRFFQEAVGAEEGMISIVRSGDSMVNAHTEVSEAGDVRQVSFATAIERLGGHVDFLKLDAEGGEWDLFDDEDSWRSIAFVAMEYHTHTGHDRADCIGFLEKTGFRLIEPALRGPEHHLVWATRATG